MQQPEPTKTMPIPSQTTGRPNERTGLNIDEFVRIQDPLTQEILVEKRG